MLKYLHRIEKPNFILTYWETSNFTITSTEKISEAGIKEALYEIEVPIPPNLAEFVQNFNVIIKDHPDLNYIYLSPFNEYSYNEILSNNALYRFYKNEMKVECQLSDQADFKEIMRELTRINVIFGIKEALIQKKIKEKNKDFFTIASGVAPRKYIPRRYRFKYQTSRIIPPNIKQKGKAIFLDFTLVNRVVRNTVLATYGDSMPSKNGQTITGNFIPPDIQEKSEVILGENVIDEDNSIIATINGIVAFDDKMIRVIPVMTINNPIVGKNIIFDGTIIVQNKAINCKIKASHDVIIHGTVEDTSVDSQGFVYLITGGIGKRTIINSTFDIFTAYIHHGTITSTAGNIYVGYESFHAKLRAKGAIIIEKKIIGGSINSQTAIKIEEAGSEKMSTPTELKLVPFTDKFDLLEDSQHQIQIYQKQLLQMKAAKQTYEIRHKHELDNLFTSPEYVKLVRIEDHLVEQIQNLKNHIASLKTFIKDKDKNVIIIFRNVWRGVKIIINQYELEIKNENFPSIFSLGDYGIMRKKYD